MGNDCAVVAAGGAQAQRRTPAGAGSSGLDRDPLCAAIRDSLGDAAARDGLRLGDDLLAASARVAGRGGLVTPASPAVGSAAPGRPDRLVPSRGGQRLRAGGFGGAHTGPNPTDRSKKGSKHHVISDAHGIPLAALTTAANVNDSTQLRALVEAIPPVRGKRGRPRRRPRIVQGDRGYDAETDRRWLRQRRILPLLAKRRTPHGSGLGTTRWVIERNPLLASSLPS